MADGMHFVWVSENAGALEGEEKMLKDFTCGLHDDAAGSFSLGWTPDDDVVRRFGMRDGRTDVEGMVRRFGADGGGKSAVNCGALDPPPSLLDAYTGVADADFELDIMRDGMTTVEEEEDEEEEAVAEAGAENVYGS